MKTFKLHLIRHGLTQGNVDRIYLGGGLDVPLCEAGIEQLEAYRTRYTYPKADLLFCSPMLRTRQSADILFPSIPERVFLDGLRENHFGEFEGRKIDELFSDKRFSDWLNPESEFIPQGGESGRAFTQRTAEALMIMMHHLAQNDIPQAICITHGGVIMSMLSQLALPREPFTHWLTENGCGYTVQADAAMLMRDGIVEVAGKLPANMD